LKRFGKVDHETFDVVVSDIGLPGLNGVDLARRIHDNLGRIPVVLMTGDPTARTNESVHQAGVFMSFDQAICPEGVGDDHL
jgi:CheY-like chemotaxis protein